jgi:hypothetical protein
MNYERGNLIFSFRGIFEINSYLEITMKSFSQLIREAQEHSSAGTSLNQVSGGLRHAAKSIIKPHSLNVDVGGGRYDAGKDHIESSVPGAKLHVYDPFNREKEHNEAVEREATGKSDYVGLHNVLNVIKEPEYRKSALHTVKSFMKPGGTAHISIYEGDKKGVGRISKADKGKGSSWQEHRPTKSYLPEINDVFPDEHYHKNFKGDNVIINHRGEK